MGMNFKCLKLSKKPAPQSLHTVRFYSYEALPKAQPQKQRTGRWLPEPGGQGDRLMRKRGGMGNLSCISYCGGSGMSVHIRPQEQCSKKHELDYM